MIRRFALGDIGRQVITQQQIARIEKMVALVSRQGENARIHTNRVTRTRFDAQATEHTAQLINGKGDREFFDRRVWMFSSLNVNA